MNRILLVRHGESIANRDHLVPGQSLDIPLTKTGERQAAQAAHRVARLVAESPAAQIQLICSDARRARQTCAAIETRLGLVASCDNRLREQDLGELEGKPTSELEALPVPEGSDITEVAWGGGETIAQVHQRLNRFWDELKPSLPELLILVAHADAFRVLEAVIAGRNHRQVDWDNPGLGLGQVKVLDLARLDPLTGGGISRQIG